MKFLLALLSLVLISVNAQSLRGLTPTYPNEELTTGSFEFKFKNEGVLRSSKDDRVNSLNTTFLGA